MRSERWWVEKVPPDPDKPQPLAHTGRVEDAEEATKDGVYSVEVQIGPTK